LRNSPYEGSFFKDCSLNEFGQQGGSRDFRIQNRAVDEHRQAGACEFEPCTDVRPRLLSEWEDDGISERRAPTIASVCEVLVRIDS
jgi:hypothetical protein